MPINKGELGEICVIKKIYSMIEDNKIDDLVKIFGDVAKGGLKLLDIESKKSIKTIECIKKAKSISKADCLLEVIGTHNLLYVSIKCEHASPPTVLNHTPRSAKCFKKGGDLRQYLGRLDKIIKRLNNKRYDGTVGEDICLANVDMSDNSKRCIANIVSYFMFDGTGSRKSKYPCNSILEIRDPTDTSLWKFRICDCAEKKITYVCEIYERLILSMRDKGMPSKHNKVCEPWVFYQEENDKEKGSLHIRLKK